MARKDRVQYKYRDDGSIRAYDSLKGTNISEQQIWSKKAVVNAILSSARPPQGVDHRTILNAAANGICPTITASYHKARSVYNAIHHGYPFVVEIMNTPPVKRCPAIVRLGFANFDHRTWGLFTAGICPSITSSQWHHNHFLIFTDTQ